MEKLADEIFLYIVSFLEARDILPLHLVCRHWFDISRDRETWKRLCFDNSHSAIAQRLKNSQTRSPVPIPEPRVLELQRAVTRSITISNLTRQEGDSSVSQSPDYPLRPNKKIQESFVSWDPSYPSEKVDWYDEYISRHAVLSTSWIQQPIGGPHSPSERREIWGLGFKKNGNNGIIVAPLDDGSVCLWNIGFADDLSNAENGRILARSKPRLLMADYQPGRLPLSKTAAQQGVLGTPECVSIDRQQNKAYFAVGDDLNVVDLETLKIVSRESYPSCIFALSDASHPTPLTVCDEFYINLHDFRLHHNAKIEAEQSGRVETNSPHLAECRIHRYPYIDDHIGRCLPTFLPQSVLHLPASNGSHDAQNGSIYVAGRIPSIMAYDRRAMSKPRCIYSGAHLCSLTSAPALSPTPTMIACGEYNGKGSLEIYPLSPTGFPSSTFPDFKNRASASSCKLLSVVPHGTRLVFSDGNGMLKWVERDGCTPVRKWDINKSSNNNGSTPDLEPPQQHGLFATTTNDQGSEDVALKLLNTGEGARDELLFWTGDRIGVVGFRKEPRFGKSFLEEGEEGKDEEGEAAAYGKGMRRALQLQADEVRFFRGFEGYGGGL